MQGELDTSGPPRGDFANLDCKHLGQAPIRASRHRIPVQSPANEEQFLTPKGPISEQDKSESPTHVPTFAGPSNEAVKKLSPKFKNGSLTETVQIHRTPVCTQATPQFSEQRSRRQQFSSSEKQDLTASQSARKIDARDAEYKASMNLLLLQLDELSVSKQRIADEFRASQQLTAQTLRRLDEECDRRQQLELRMIESEAALKVIGRIFEGKNEELEEMRMKLDMVESRNAKLEQLLARMTSGDQNHEDSKLHDALDAPDLPSQLKNTQHLVSFLVISCSKKRFVFAKFTNAIAENGKSIRDGTFHSKEQTLAARNSKHLQSPLVWIELETLSTSLKSKRARVLRVICNNHTPNYPVRDKCT